MLLGKLCALMQPPPAPAARRAAAAQACARRPAPTPLPQVLALPVASIPAFIYDQSLGKSAGLLFSLMWLQERLEAHSGRLAQAQA